LIASRDNLFRKWLAYSKDRKEIMLRWAIAFFLIAIVAAAFGFGGIAAGAVEIARVLFFIFLVLFLVALVAGALRGRPQV
jgi:uncharacterized membrane protein YtjA (UPF0391 family)